MLLGRWIYSTSCATRAIGPVISLYHCVYTVLTSVVTFAELCGVPADYADGVFDEGLATAVGPSDSVKSKGFCLTAHAEYGVG